MCILIDGHCSLVQLVCVSAMPLRQALECQPHYGSRQTEVPLGVHQLGFVLAQKKCAP